MADDKIVNLADRRAQRLGMVNLDPNDRDDSINGPFYDLWVEADGSLMLRVDAQRMTTAEHPLRFGTAEDSFVVRGNALELRIAPNDVAQLVDNVETCGYTVRRILEQHRGDLLWQCEPLGDGTYRVRHRRKAAVFEPFRCRGRFGPRRAIYVDGVCLPGERERLAPACSACRRVVQVGETMYRERHRPWHGKFNGAQLCSGCITQAPRAGISEVSSENGSATP